MNTMDRMNQILSEGLPAEFDFDGATYNRALDHDRLKGQLKAVRDLMSDGHWRSLGLIAEEVGCSPASASARLRDLRKEKFGAYNIERQRHEEFPVFVYRMVGGKGEGTPAERHTTVSCPNCGHWVQV